MGGDGDRRPTAAVIVKHSLTIAGHRTSISLEEAFWSGLRSLAGARGLSVAALVAEIDAARGAANLSSAIRVFVLEHRTEASAALAQVSRVVETDVVN